MFKRPLIAAVTLVLSGACYQDDLASPTRDLVATVTVIPATATMSVSDTVRFRAELRDGGGAMLAYRPVSWSLSDTAVIQVEGTFGAEVVVRARAIGSAVVRATSEGSMGEAGVTVR